MILWYVTRFYIMATRLAKLVAAIPWDEISIVAAFSMDLVTVPSQSTSEMLRESQTCFNLNSTSTSIHDIHLHPCPWYPCTTPPRSHRRRSACIQTWPYQEGMASKGSQFLYEGMGRVWDWDGEARVPPRHSKPASSWQSEEQPSCKANDQSSRYQKGWRKRW